MSTGEPVSFTVDITPGNVAGLYALYGLPVPTTWLDPFDPAHEHMELRVPGTVERECEAFRTWLAFGRAVLWDAAARRRLEVLGHDTYAVCTLDVEAITLGTFAPSEAHVREHARHYLRRDWLRYSIRRSRGPELAALVLDTYARTHPTETR